MKSTLKRLQQQQLPSCLNNREGWARLFALKRPTEPHLHQIEPTNHCPYACIMCPRSKHMNRARGFMEFKLYTRVIDEVAGYSPETKTKEIELFHFGESLLHPQIAAMVGYAVDKGLNIVLSVNAPQLTSKLAEQLLCRHPGKIIISLDGYDQESYRQIRGANADYKMAVANIQTLMALHRQMNSTVEICIRMIRLRINEDHIDEFTQNWQGYGVTVEIRDFFPWNLKEFTSLGERPTFPAHMPCPFPWQYLVVQWNGDVVPCCRDFNAVNVMGNVGNDSLLDIWNGPAYARFRHQMVTGAYDHKNSICPECMSIYADKGEGMSNLN